MIRQYLHLLLLACTALGGIRTVGPAAIQGPKHWPVAGKVTFQGKPVSKRHDPFQQSRDRRLTSSPSSAPTAPYVIDTARGPGLPEGSYQVDITPVSPAASEHAWSAAPSAEPS